MLEVGIKLNILTFLFFQPIRRCGNKSLFSKEKIKTINLNRMNATEKSIDPVESSTTTATRQTTSSSSNNNTNTGADSFEQQFLTMEGTQQPKQNLLL